MACSAADKIFSGTNDFVTTGAVTLVAEVFVDVAAVEVEAEVVAREDDKDVGATETFETDANVTDSGARAGACTLVAVVALDDKDACDDAEVDVATASAALPPRLE